MINNQTRRHFIKINTLAGLALVTPSLENKKYRPLLSFSTLGCPDWSLKTILDFAAKNGYDGIEFRGLQRQLELPKCTEFSSKENIVATLNLCKEKKIKIVIFGASAEMHHVDPVQRKKNLDEAKSFIDLAHQLDCPYIRVLPNSFPKDLERNKTIDLVAKALLELGEYARHTGVKVLMETHGDVVKSEDVAEIMRASNHPSVGLVWDIVNMWSATREPVAQVYAKLKKFICHTHIKDIRFVGNEQECVLLGKGDTPIFEAIDILAKNKYKGFYSFEWEEFWHPNIVKPEVAIADYSNVLRKHFNLKVKS